MSTFINGLRPSLCIVDDIANAIRDHIPTLKSNKLPTSHYLKVPKQSIPRYVSLLADEISKGHLEKFSPKALTSYAVISLRDQTVSNYRNDLEFGPEPTLFMHYLHHFNLAEDSLLFLLLMEEFKLRKLNQIL